MYKKLSQEQLNTLLHAAIREFADKGYERASISAIARLAGVSVGVIYKYYEDKAALFLACVRISLEPLNDALQEAVRKGDHLEDSLESIIRTLIRHSKENQEVNRMYHEITGNSAHQLSRELSREIEEMSSRVYTALIRKAQAEGRCRIDADPRLFAFFLDDLFMMLQFSYSCDYYRERLKLYGGEDILQDDGRIAVQLQKFLAGALGLRTEP